MSMIKLSGDLDSDFSSNYWVSFKDGQSYEMASDSDYYEFKETRISDDTTFGER
jgi:hypothetical protein